MFEALDVPPPFAAKYELLLEVEVGHPPTGTTVGIVAHVFGACKTIA
jgi:hypothetical protein